MQERQAGVAARHHQRHVVRGGDRIDDAGERVLLQPDLDVGVGVGPERLAVEPGGLLERLLDAAEGARLALPPGVVGEPVVGQIAGPAHQHEVGLHLGVAGLGLLDDAADGGLVEHLPDRHRLHRLDDLERALAPAVSTSALVARMRFMGLA